MALTALLEQSKAVGEQGPQTDRMIVGRLTPAQQARKVEELARIYYRTKIAQHLLERDNND